MGCYYCFISVFGEQVIDVELHNCISKSSALEMGLNIVKDYESQNVDFDIKTCSSFQILYLHAMNLLLKPSYTIKQVYSQYPFRIFLK